MAKDNRQQATAHTHQTQLTDNKRLQVVGLGNTYRVCLSLRLNLAHWSDDKCSHLLSRCSGPATATSPKCHVLVSSPRGQCQLKPFRFEVELFSGFGEKPRIVEKSIEFKLIIERCTFDGHQWNLGPRPWAQASAPGDQSSLSLDVSRYKLSKRVGQQCLLGVNTGIWFALVCSQLTSLLIYLNLNQPTY